MSTKKEREFVNYWAEEMGITQTWEQRGMQQGIQQGIQNLLKFLESGHTLEEAKRKFTFA